MKRLTCNLIAAVGRRGQLGLNGQLPWQDREDLSYFKSMTGSDVIIVGRRTFETLPTLPNRIVVGIGHGRLLVKGDPKVSEIDTAAKPHPTTVLGECFMRWPDKVWWVAGGAVVFRDFIEAGVVRRSHITHTDYDGPADAYFPWDAYGHHHQEEDPIGTITTPGVLRPGDIIVGKKRRAKA